MHEVNYQRSDVICEHLFLCCRIRPEGLLYDAAHNLLAIAKFLVADHWIANAWLNVTSYIDTAAVRLRNEAGPNYSIFQGVCQPRSAFPRRSRCGSMPLTARNCTLNRR